MPEYPRSPFEKTGTSITPNIDGDAIDATIIGSTTPAAGSFTTMTVDTDLVVTEGDIDIVHADGKLLLPLKNDAANPTVAFGDGDSGFYESSDDNIGIAAGGLVRYNLTTTQINANSSDMWVLRRQNATYTTPNIHPRKGDVGTGIGQGAADALSLIAGGVEGHRITEAAGTITHELTDIVQGNLLNNWMVQKAGFDVLGLMTDPRFLNLMCEDPGAGTMTDVSGQGHDGTYQGSMTTGDRVKKGMGWSIDFDNTSDYIGIADHNDLSFGDATNDEAVTFFGVFEVTASAGLEPLISKWHTGATLREWRIDIDIDEKLIISFYDESVNILISRITDASISNGWHTYAITYNGAGGASAADTIKIYIDGALVASTASNNASYVAMENLAIGVRISSGNDDLYYNGEVACTGIDGAEWSSFDVHRFHQLMKGIYGL